MRQFLICLVDYYFINIYLKIKTNNSPSLLGITNFHHVTNSGEVFINKITKNYNIKLKYYR